MSRFTMTQITCPALPDVHSGTGTFTRRSWIATPAFVDPPMKGVDLEFQTVQSTVTTMLFQTDSAMAPNWFAVAVPQRLTSFTHVNLFCHPNPAGAGMTEQDYAAKGGQWPRLFRYMEVLGFQLAASGRSQVLIMPYFRSSSSHDAGVLTDEWRAILTDILHLACASASPPGTPGQDLCDLVVSSFSYGIRYSDTVRSQLRGLNNVLTEIWDFDGIYSRTEGHLSRVLVSRPGVRALKYGQSAAPEMMLVPKPRWRRAPFGAPADTDAVHQLIPGTLFNHACLLSRVG